MRDNDSLLRVAPICFEAASLATVGVKVKFESQKPKNVILRILPMPNYDKFTGRFLGIDTDNSVSRRVNVLKNNDSV